MTQTRSRNSTEENCFYVILSQNVTLWILIISAETHGKDGIFRDWRGCSHAHSRVMPSRPPGATGNLRTAAEAQWGSEMWGEAQEMTSLFNFSSIAFSTYDPKRWHFDLFFVSVTLLPNTDSSNLLKIIVAKYIEHKIYPFKVYNSDIKFALRILQPSSSIFFIFPNWNSVPIVKEPTIPCPPSPWQPLFYLFSVDFFIL